MEEFSSASGLSSSGSNSSISAKTALSECSAAWINYLNVLNNLCTAGCKLSNSITKLLECGVQNEKSGPLFKNHPTVYLTNSWNDLARATTVATNTVKTHILGVLQDYVTLSSSEQSASSIDLDQKRFREHNELICLENAQAVVNVQHQFCAASYDAFLSLTCCFVCQSPVGYPHEQDCSMAKQRLQHETRSQTPSPNFCGTGVKSETSRVAPLVDQRSMSGNPESVVVEQPRGPSPHFRDGLPMQAIFENTKGPLPNPGHLLSMKMPFHRSTKSPLNFSLFPLNGQRRWSEAAAGEVIDGMSGDSESQMRRWSMPWEASKSDQNTVTWNQTRIMPMNALKLSHQKMAGSERYSHASETSQDGLSEAIHLLSFKPARAPPLNQQPSFSSPTAEGPNIE